MLYEDIRSPMKLFSTFSLFLQSSSVKTVHIRSPTMHICIYKASGNYNSVLEALQNFRLKRPLKQTDLEQALTSPKATEAFLAMKLFSANPGYKHIW